MDEPAEAAYYLKKVQVEYGGKDLDARIRRLMRLAGTERFYTQDEWIAWSAFRRKWGWLINTLMCVGAVITAIGFLRPGFFRKPAMRMARGFAGILLLVTCLLNSYHLVMSGERAVVVKPTSFYREPGFASTSDPTTIGIGETVKVLDHQDIWVRVDAGGGDWWVPARVLRTL